jgi:hypothetical protein
VLETPEKIRELQRKRYRKAKQEKEYRFYLLYESIKSPFSLSMQISTNIFSLGKVQVLARNPLS